MLQIFVHNVLDAVRRGDHVPLRDEGATTDETAPDEQRHVVRELALVRSQAVDDSLAGKVVGTCTRFI